MKTLSISIAVALLALSGCATHAPGADQVRITKKAADVEGCEALGQVHSTPPYILPNEDYVQLRNAALVLKADTVLITSPRIVSTRGIAYRCQRT